MSYFFAPQGPPGEELRKKCTDFGALQKAVKMLPLPQDLNKNSQKRGISWTKPNIQVSRGSSGAYILCKTGVKKFFLDQTKHSSVPFWS